MLEKHYSVPELARAWNFSQETIRRLFRDEPGVIVIHRPRRRTRIYITIRIPESVAQRVYARLQKREAAPSMKIRNMYRQSIIDNTISRAPPVRVFAHHCPPTRRCAAPQPCALRISMSVLETPTRRVSVRGSAPQVGWAMVGNAECEIRTQKESGCEQKPDALGRSSRIHHATGVPWSQSGKRTHDWSSVRRAKTVTRFRFFGTLSIA